MGAEATPPSVGIVFGAEVLMHVLFWLPTMSESDGAPNDQTCKWQLRSALPQLWLFTYSRGTLMRPDPPEPNKEAHKPALEVHYSLN